MLCVELWGYSAFLFSFLENRIIIILDIKKKNRKQIEVGPWRIPLRNCGIQGSLLTWSPLRALPEDSLLRPWAPVRGATFARRAQRLPEGESVCGWCPGQDAIPHGIRLSPAAHLEGSRTGALYSSLRVPGALPGSRHVALSLSRTS